MSEGRPISAMDTDAPHARVEITWVPAWFGRWRRASIRIDDVEVGKLKQGRSLALEVPPGAHSIQARLDWVRTPPLEVDPRPGELVRVELTLRSPGLGAAFAGFVSLVLPGRVLVLRRIAGPSL